jgi:hypothetical protein
VGRLDSEGQEQTGTVAREMFDRAATDAYKRAHQLLRVKYQSIEVLPYYYLFRERAAIIACRVAGRRGLASSPTPRAAGARPSRRLVETMLTSADGLIVGRPDYVDLQAREILDYKTGASADDTLAVSPAEARQLRLYVHLALENALSVSRGVIVQPGGRRAETEVTRSEADSKGRLAREVLERFNKTVGLPFEAAAEPSKEACHFCPCIPFCEPFWRAAAPSWLENCGTHIQGRITAITEIQIQGIPVLTFELDVSRGTVGAPRVFVEQVPESWTTIGGRARPSLGEVLRIVHGRASAPGLPRVIRVDRALTSLWSVSAAHAFSSVQGGSD